MSKYYVQDLLALDSVKPRIHTIIGPDNLPHSFSFTAGQKVEVEEFFRNVFIKIPEGFLVTNEAGQVLQYKAPIKESETVVLATDEVIAKISDLKSDALRRLAKSRGIKFGPKTKDDDIITELTIDVLDGKSAVEVADEAAVLLDDGEVVPLEEKVA